MPKPRIRLKLSDIDVRKVSDGEESVADNILVKIKDEATATREGIDKLNDVMTRLADAFAASLVLEKKEINRQVKKDQREKTEGDIADDVKKKKERGVGNPFGVGVAAAANPFAALGSGLGKLGAGLGGLIGSILGVVGKGLLKFLSKNLWKALKGNLGKFLPAFLTTRLDKMFDMVDDIPDVDGTGTGTGTADDPKQKKEDNKNEKGKGKKGNWKKAFSKLARSLSTVARVAGVVGLPLLAYELIEFMAPYAKEAMKRRMDEATKREDEIGKKVGDSIDKFKKEQTDMQSKLNAAVLAGDKDLIEKIETQMSEERAKFSKELADLQAQLDAARAETQRESQIGEGVRKNTLSDEQRLAAQQAVDMGVEVGRNQGILNKGKVQDYLDMVRSHLDGETSKEELQKFIKSQGGMDKFKMQIDAYAPGILGNDPLKDTITKVASIGGETDVQRRRRFEKEVSRANAEFGDQGMDMMYSDPRETMKDYGRLVESRKEKEKKWIRDHNRKMKDRERATHATGYKTKNFDMGGAFEEFSIKKYSPKLSSDLGRSRTNDTRLQMDDTYSVPTPVKKPAVRVEEPEPKSSFLIKTAKTAYNALVSLFGGGQDAEQVIKEQSEQTKQLQEINKKLAKDAENKKGASNIVAGNGNVTNINVTNATPVSISHTQNPSASLAIPNAR